jgi:hypothetical protein
MLLQMYFNFLADIFRLGFSIYGVCFTLYAGRMDFL